MADKNRPIWETDFFPDEGERHSPVAYIKRISRKNERAQIFHRIDALTKLEAWEWPPLWVENFKDGLYQLKSGDHRIYFGLGTEPNKRVMIFCYACRKAGQKAKPKDVQRARDNLNQYRRLDTE